MSDNAEETLDQPLDLNPAPPAINADTDALDETIVQTDAPTPPRKKTEPPTDEEMPEHFGRYHIDRLLGQGAMGSVYLAQDTQLNRNVALKVPQFSANGPADLIERFYREARSAATLTHPNICPVYDVGEHEGQHFISMGYIEGRPLADYVESGRQQPERKVAGVIRKLAQALQEAHDHGIIHRDLKPANIMIDRRNEPIVMDFGLARQADDQGDAKLTRDGTILGSPSYMSPEQVTGGKLGPATDIYSLGVVLFEMLTGRTPFEGTVTSVIGQIMHTDAQPAIKLRTDITPGISAICAKAMAKKPEDRFASMKEFSSALGALLKGDASAVEANVGLSVSDDRETTVQQLKKQKSRATTLIKSGQFKSAVDVLETLVEDAGDQNVDIAEWARKQLPQAQEKYDNSAEECRSLYRRAKKSFDSGDYDRAVQLLDQIPPDMENRAVVDMKAEAGDFSAEVQSLSEEVEYAVQTGELEGMLPSVERLLELKPNHRKASELYDELYSAKNTRPASSQRRPRKRKKKAALSIPAMIGGGCAVLAVIALVVIFGGDDPEDTGTTDGTVASSTAGSDAGANPVEPANDLPVEPGDRQPGQAFGQFPKTPEGILARFDEDDDGKLSQQEVPRTLMKRLDRNGDRILSLEELQEADRATDASIVASIESELTDGPDQRPREPGFDDRPPRDGPPNGPGPGGPDGPGPEGRGPEGGRLGNIDDPIPMIFGRLDGNEDGVLDFGEAPRRLMERADKNRDGELTLKELEDAAAEHGRNMFRPPPRDGDRPPRDGRFGEGRFGGGGGVRPPKDGKRPPGPGPGPEGPQDEE